MNPFEDRGVALRYERWYETAGQTADVREKKLLARLLRTFPAARSILEIGCGTGHFTRWFSAQGYGVVGIDASPAMLVEAKRRDTIPYILGDAHHLPFDDQCFDIVSFVTTLEFLADPERALREALRVARRGLLLGVLNRHSLFTRRYRRTHKASWQGVRFFTPRELSRLLQIAAEGCDLRLLWRTTLWPFPWLGDLPLPWGGFIGMAAHVAACDSRQIA